MGPSLGRALSCCIVVVLVIVEVVVVVVVVVVGSALNLPYISPKLL